MIRSFKAQKTVIQRHFKDSRELCDYAREHYGNTVLLSFSRGKDALGAWLQLRDFGFDVKPFFLDSVPGMKFVERDLQRHERFFGVHVERYIHPNFVKQLTQLTHAAPTAWPILQDKAFMRGLRSVASIRAVEDDMRERFNCPTALVATGVRAADSLRYTAMKKHGSLTPSKLKFHPVYDWSTKHLIERLRTAGIKLSHEYRWLGRTFDGIHSEYLEPLKREHPEDFERVQHWFGVAAAELARVRLYEKHGKGPH